MIVVISELTTLELKDAPREVRNIVRDIPEKNIEYVELTEEAVNLAGKYIAEGVIGKLVDAEHIAIATINRVCGRVSELELQTHCKLTEDSWIQFCKP